MFLLDTCNDEKIKEHCRKFENSGKTMDFRATIYFIPHTTYIPGVPPSTNYDGS